MKFLVFMMYWIAACFFFEQNQFFGWNALPQSQAELIADGITSVLIALAVLVHQLSKPHKVS